MSSSDAKNVTIKVHTDTTELDAVTQKVERLNELLKEAVSLAGKLASKEINISVNVE